MNSEGKVVIFVMEQSSKEIHIPTENLSPGIYTLTLAGNDGSLYHLKMVKAN